VTARVLLGGAHVEDDDIVALRPLEELRAAHGLERRGVLEVVADDLLHLEETGAGKGQGFSANVPFAPGTDDEIFTWAFDEVVPPLIGAFAPDILVTQLGADTHHTDPLANLSLTTRGFAHAVRAFRALGRPWIALGGGGYDVANVPRAWTLAWAFMNDAEPPAGVPEAYRAACRALDLRADPLLDEPHRTTGRAKETAWAFARDQVARGRQLIFPHHGLAAGAGGPPEAGG